MTVLLTFVGVIVFIISFFTSSFKTGWKRLMLFAVTGVIIDALIIGIFVAVTYATHLR